MGDSLITIIAIFLAAVLMFIFPLMSISERADDVSQLSVQTATTEFVDKVRTTGKLTLENDGIDGFLIKIEIIKSRSNQAGQEVTIVYDKVKGVSPIRTCIQFAKDNGLIGGNRNSMYFINNKDSKFQLRSVEECFNQNKELYSIMYQHIVPLLSTRLSQVTSEELEMDNEIMDY